MDLAASSAVSRLEDLGLPDLGARSRGSSRGLLRLLRLGAALALLAAGLALAPSGQARVAATLVLDVDFTADGTISVALPDGTPVGSTTGSPTVIPAGYYTLRLTGPGACSELPYFELKGPGENLLENMDLGEMKAADTAYFLPNSTYTWRDDALPGVVYTFVTSADVVGTPPPAVSVAPPKSSVGPHSSNTAQDIVGSAVVPFRGTLTGVVSAGGRLTFAYRGKSVTSLAPGRYRITVTDRSATSGFTVAQARPRHATLSVTGTTFVGKRSASVDLTAGKWLFASSLRGRGTYSIVVS